MGVSAKIPRTINKARTFDAARCLSQRPDSRRYCSGLLVGAKSPQLVLRILLGLRGGEAEQAKQGGKLTACLLFFPLQGLFCQIEFCGDLRQLLAHAFATAGSFLQFFFTLTGQPGELGGLVWGLSTNSSTSCKSFSAVASDHRGPRMLSIRSFLAASLD